MVAIRKGARYFDLFDDDLYKWFNSESSSLFSDHLDNLRLQMMACLLFDGSVVVPEQWLVSSPTFGRIAAEIITPWLKMRDEEKLPTDAPPIVPAYFESASPYADERFLAALERRLSAEKPSPIRLSPALDTDSETVNFQKRFEFQQELKWLLSLSRYDLHEKHYVKRCFRKHIDDPKMADSVFKVYECLRRTYPDFVNFNQRSYNLALNTHVGNIYEIISGGSELQDLDSDLHKGWQLFFQKAAKERINLSSITALRGVLDRSSFDIKHINSIESVGRYCMHMSLSEMCQGELSSTAYNIYEPARQGAFEIKIFEEERKKGAKSSMGTHDSSGDILIDSLELLYRRGTGLRSKFSMDWPSIWESFWAFKCSDAYVKDRQTLLSRLRRGDNQKACWANEQWETYQLESWDLFFERLSKELRFIHFEMNPKDRRYVNVFTRYTKAPKKMQDFLKNAAYIGAGAAADLAHPGLAAPVMALLATGVLCGQGIENALSGDRARAGFELAAETLKSRTQLGKREK